jgi:geranylgeranyl diphosphate synthase, type II
MRCILLVQQYFDSRKDMLEEQLKEYLAAPAYPDYAKDALRLHEAMNYTVLNGGKRLRPILLFAAYEMLKGKKSAATVKPVQPCACALEMVHTASLIHDDLPSVDNSDERRGQPTCHKKFDEATAILAGDALLTRAFEVLTEIKDKQKALRCITILTRAVSSRGMIGGQTVDILSSRRRIRINVLKYIHLKKTGALLQTAMDLACVMAGAEENITITLGNYALNLGLAYQVIDDILDDVGAFEFLGKEPYEDHRNRKNTYPSLIGLDKSRKIAEKLLDDSYKLIKNMKGNEVLVEFINMIRDRLP